MTIVNYELQLLKLVEYNSFKDESSIKCKTVIKFQNNNFRNSVHCDIVY